ncbi:VOC family protein [Agrobacterium vitis]|uniref:VOC family protein n=1 Tax=Agrobacterium vitis TaxID=373 RepID=A0A368NW04_AGRVI|nr:VOC family protein [Agrobacterium vitis]KAA3519996.1 VOC family protein [Agrobacterium vitis]KAA3532510.1 VOC family protein [Agrobacterium vitis]MCF1475680.1 VOC family protein [Agrobacterium vitis]MUZ95087.1 VOC family protein [Agrobacterium vitis]MVA29554.1 VOC family protein [Agrobacterium vitis]
MIDHMNIKVADFERARAFYDAAFAPLGASLLYMVPAEYSNGVKMGGYGRDRPVYWLHEGAPAVGYHQHIAFTANSRAEVDAFYQAAIAAGGKDNGPPGLRPHYHPNYYGAFVFDLDGNNIEAVCHARVDV